MSHIVKNPLSNNVMYNSMMNPHLTDVRTYPSQWPTSTISEKDQMSQSNTESDNLTGRRDH